MEKKFIDDFIIWLTGGIIYFYMEMALRGYSHYSMIVCGGFCFLFVGKIGDEILRKRRTPIAAIAEIMVSGAFVITSIEFITGIIVNVILGLDVWDYSQMKYNIAGQICLSFSVLWALLSLVCVYLGKIIRKKILDEY